MSFSERVLDAHCEATGGVLPRDPAELRQWLLGLVERARAAEQRARELSHRRRYETF
jgi:hypothetical protein